MSPADIIPKILDEPVKKITRLSGGDINAVYSVQTGARYVVIKINRADSFPGMLQKEAKGLSILAAAGRLKTPGLIGQGETDGMQYLVLEKIETGPADKKFWTRFGQQLACLHQQTSAQFGLDHDNYIGSLVQVNKQCSTWSEFFTTRRLQPMVEMAVNQGDINYVESKIFDAFYKRVDELFPHEKPALLHGDLWSGNYLAASDGEAVLIDPAVYYGHREIDLGMMHLFGGFSDDLFQAYHEVYPLENGWKERLPFTQLYPLMVHVNLFGRSYWERVRAILAHFGSS